MDQHDFIYEPEIPAKLRQDRFVWDGGRPPRSNCEKLVEALSESTDLFRPVGKEGLLVRRQSLDLEWITTAKRFWPVIFDRLDVAVLSSSGNITGGQIPTAHLDAILQSDSLREGFLPLNLFATSPRYMSDFRLLDRGYHQDPDGRYYLYLGPQPEVSSTTEHIDRFLDVMDFAGPADRTNAVAAALTVMLRHHWPGAKPIILATATKSHAGKDTVIQFAAGTEEHVSIGYQATDWAIDRNFTGAIKSGPDIGVVIVENARLTGRDQLIASAFLERTATTPEVFLFSTGTGAPITRTNDFVIAISTNYGSVSEDILNRSLPIHLAPQGDIASRVSPIGNPRFEYLPQYNEAINAELRGMIARWREAGMPLDTGVRHPATAWAKTIGGILQANGYDEFLGNYGMIRTCHDPVKTGLGILGAEHPGKWYRSGEWAISAEQLGLSRQILSGTYSTSHPAREREIGKVMSAHRDEVLDVETDAESLQLRLERGRNREGGGEPKVRYRFVVVDRQPIDDA